MTRKTKSHSWVLKDLALSRSHHDDTPETMIFEKTSRITSWSQPDTNPLRKSCEISLATRMEYDRADLYIWSNDSKDVCTDVRIDKEQGERRKIEWMKEWRISWCLSTKSLFIFKNIQKYKCIYYIRRIRQISIYNKKNINRNNIWIKQWEFFYYFEYTNCIHKLK